MSKENYRCRVCQNESVEKIYLNKIGKFSYLWRDNNWVNIFCKSCGSFSHFSRDKSKTVRYSDSSYRENSNLQKPKMPISLPWSTVSCLRSTHISKIINYSNALNPAKKGIGYNLLDFGGYNGFTAYSMQSYLNLKQIFLADLDPNGLKIANSLGINCIDLANQPIEKLHFQDLDVVSAVHVIEHLEDPIYQLSFIHNFLNNDGLLYVEVPNMYGFAFNDPAHLTSFNLESLSHLLVKSGFIIIDSGYVSTPKESFNYDYQNAHSKENIYCLAKKVDKNKVKELKFNFKKNNRNKIFILLRLSFCNLRYQIKVFENIILNFLRLLIRIIKSLIKIILSPVSNLLFILINLK